MATKKTGDLPLEKALVELETLVDKMESSELSLDDSLKLFERGVSLTKKCQKMLGDAKQKIELISSDFSDKE